MVVSDVPHTTRDSIATKIMYKNRKIELIDTAGLNTPNLDRNK
jgi:predicted GTPase